MKDQVHIRNAEAAHLARALARQTGKSMSEVVLEALRHYRPETRAVAAADQLKRWRRLLRQDGPQTRRPETPLDELYDDATGLPA